MQRGSGDGKLKKVSQAYNPYTPARHVDCKVTFEAVNTVAQNSATVVSVFDQSTLSNLSQIMNGSRAQKTFASCEPFATFLNGKYSFLPDDLSECEIGYISDDYSDENCENALSYLIVSFPEAVTLAGFTIAFEPESYATEIEFSVSSGSDIVVREKIKNNSGVCTIEIPLVNVTKINLLFSRTRYPHTHVRVSELTCGIIKEWDKHNILTAEFESGVDIYGEALQASVATISVDNSDGEYNAINRTTKYVDLPVRAKTTFTDSDAASFSQVTQLKDGEKVFPVIYATCEQGVTLLNGKYHFLPDEVTTDVKTGFMSAQVSDENGNFDTPPKVIASFSAAQEHSGFRIYFGDFYATKMRISIYSGESLIISDVIENANPVAEIALGAENYDKVIFEFLSTNEPQKGIKISEIDFLKSAESWVKSLTEDSPISASFTINGEKINIANKNLFFSEFSADNDNMSATFTFTDRAEALDNITITEDENSAGNGSVINPSSGQTISVTAGRTTLSAAVSSLLAATNLTAKYLDGVGENAVWMYISGETSMREAFRKLAQAAMCTCWIDTDGVLTFGKIKHGTVCDVINGENRYYWSGEKLANFVDCVILNLPRGNGKGSFTAGSGKNSVTIDNEFVDTPQPVAAWLLEQYKRRSSFEIETRGNPAIDIGDTVSIQDISQEYQLAEVCGTDYVYDGGLKCTVKAVESK